MATDNQISMCLMLSPDVESAKKNLDNLGVQYYLHEGNDRFKGTPIPMGWIATYQKPEIGGDSLEFSKVSNSDTHQ